MRMFEWLVIIGFVSVAFDLWLINKRLLYLATQLDMIGKALKQIEANTT